MAGAVQRFQLSAGLRNGERPRGSASHAQTWELALYADNLTDKRYAYTGGTLGTPLSQSPTIAWNFPGPRRTAGVEGTYRWNPTH